MKIDKLDLRILTILLKNARTTFVDMSKMFGVEPGIIRNRYQKMKKIGIITGTTILVDLPKIERFFETGLMLKIAECQIEETIEYLITLNSENTLIQWYNCYGAYDLLVVVLSKKLIDGQKIKKNIELYPTVLNVRQNVKKNFQTNYQGLNLQKLLER